MNLVQLHHQTFSSVIFTFNSTFSLTRYHKICSNSIIIVVTTDYKPRNHTVH